jgi:hypothetical protein
MLTGSNAKGQIRYCMYITAAFSGGTSISCTRLEWIRLHQDQGENSRTHVTPSTFQPHSRYHLDRIDYKQQAQTGRLFEPAIELVESLPLVP